VAAQVTIKTTPGTCGYGTPDTDHDDDGTPDCSDACLSEDATKVLPDVSGCIQGRYGSRCRWNTGLQQ